VSLRFAVMWRLRNGSRRIRASRVVRISDSDIQAAGSLLYEFRRGTSMATAHASGVAALIIGQHAGSMNPEHVKARLRSSADDLGKPGKDDFYGMGRINALRAVSE
jgi:hypothetical protein